MNDQNIPTIDVGRHRVVAEAQIGEGGFSYVSLVRDINSDSRLVLKRMVCQNKETLDMARKEVELMKKLQHRNLVEYRDSQIKPMRGNSSGNASEVLILMEYCGGGHLLGRMKTMQKSSEKFKWQELLEIFRDLCRAIKYLHEQVPAIAHRDLKLENVLKSVAGPYKLCDFGSCVEGRRSVVTKAERANEQEVIEKTTTKVYRAPEMRDLDGTAMFGAGFVDEKVDIWALGCILYTMAFFKPPFPENGCATDRFKIPDDSPYPTQLGDLLKAMLVMEPDKRLSIGEINDAVDALLSGDTLPSSLKQGGDEKKNIKKKKKKSEKSNVEGTPSGNISNDSLLDFDSTPGTKAEGLPIQPEWSAFQNQQPTQNWDAFGPGVSSRADPFAINPPVAPAIIPDPFSDFGTQLSSGTGQKGLTNYPLSPLGMGMTGAAPASEPFEDVFAGLDLGKSEVLQSPSIPPAHDQLHYNQQAGVSFSPLSPTALNSSGLGILSPSTARTAFPISPSSVAATNSANTSVGASMQSTGLLMSSGPGVAGNLGELKPLTKSKGVFADIDPLGGRF